LDSLYLVLEYPHDDVFTRWSAQISDLNHPHLYDGILLKIWSFGGVVWATSCPSGMAMPDSSSQIALKIA